MELDTKKLQWITKDLYPRLGSVHVIDRLQITITIIMHRLACRLFCSSVRFVIYSDYNKKCSKWAICIFDVVVGGNKASISK